MSPAPKELPPDLMRRLDELADEDAAGILSAARVRARARVREVVEEALVERLLARMLGPEVTDEDHQEPQRAIPETLGAPKDLHDEVFYLYGVVRAGDAALAAHTPGVPPGGPVETVTADALSAVVSRVPLSEFGDEHLKENLERLDWLERTARAHEQVVESMCARCTTIPIRLCTLFRGPETIRAMLLEEADHLGDALDRLTGRTEWSVKVLGDLARVSAAFTASPEGAEVNGDASAGRRYLQARQDERRTADRADRWLRQAVRDVHETLAIEAGIGLRNPVQSPELSGYDEEMLLNGVYLVDDLLTDAFCKCVDDLNARYQANGFRLELTGPWPPYNFVSPPT